MRDFEKAYMDEYAESFFPPETPKEDLPEVFPMRAGALDGEMKAIEQSDFQRLAEKAGMTLEEFGESIESLGSVRLGQFEISLRDLLPFVGGSVEETDPVTGEVTKRTTGTPAALQQYGQGVSMTTGTGFARQLRPDFKEAVFDLFELAGIFKAGGAIGKKAIEAAPEVAGRVVEGVGEKAAEMAEDFLTDRGLLLRFGPDDKQIEIPAAPKPETPEFQNWFGESKVLDDTGNPLVMYHGTKKTENGEAFTIFDTYSSQYGLFGQGSYFTADPSVASSYTKKGKGDAPTVYPVYLSIKNPIDMDAKANPDLWKRYFPDAEDLHDGGETNESWFRAVEEFYEQERVPDYEAAEAIQGGLMEMGYDGITHIGGGRASQSEVRHRVYIAFDPEQVKSVFNKGTWNPNDPRINYGVGAGGASGAGAATQMEQE